MQPNRSQIKPGIRVKIVLKQHQKSGKLTEGIVKDILTNTSLIPTESKYDLQTAKSVEYRQ